MEDLNKQQIILLTLLVSFVTSIATGITTVSLLDQAPRGVTQTINHVVEKTIETVVPSTDKQNTTPPPKEVTVVVKEEELVIKAVESLKNSIIRIKNKKNNDFLGIGVVVGSGIVAADESVVGLFRGVYSGNYQGNDYDLTYISTDDATGIAFFKINGNANVAVIPMAKGGSIKAGQSIIAVSGAERDTVSIGIISSAHKEDIVKNNATSTVTVGIDTTINSSSLISGTPFASLDGELLGIKAGKDGNTDVIRTTSVISDALSRLKVE